MITERELLDEIANVIRHNQVHGTARKSHAQGKAFYDPLQLPQKLNSYVRDSRRQKLGEAARMWPSAASSPTSPAPRQRHPQRASRTASQPHRRLDMRGRRPKPTRLKVLTGNPGKRPLNAHKSRPEIAVPDCPPELGPVAQRE